MPSDNIDDDLEEINYEMNCEMKGWFMGLHAVSKNLGLKYGDVLCNYCIDVYTRHIWSH